MTPTSAYDERLTVPWWWWPVTLAIMGLFAAELHGGVPGPQAVVPYVVLLPGGLLALAALSRARVRVQDGVLSVPGGHVIPVSGLMGGRRLDPAEVRGLLATGTPVLLARRPWVPTAVLLTLSEDAAPWLVSTAHPDELLAVLTTDPAASV